jgi:hypothetical protein
MEAHTYIHTYVHKHMQMHTHTHTHTHTSQYILQQKYTAGRFTYYIMSKYTREM